MCVDLIRLINKDGQMECRLDQQMNKMIFVLQSPTGIVLHCTSLLPRIYNLHSGLTSGERLIYLTQIYTKSYPENRVHRFVTSVFTLNCSNGTLHLFLLEILQLYKPSVDIEIVSNTTYYFFYSKLKVFSKT